MVLQNKVILLYLNVSAKFLLCLQVSTHSIQLVTNFGKLAQQQLLMYDFVWYLGEVRSDAEVRLEHANLTTASLEQRRAIFTSLPVVENPSCLQATMASKGLQESSHTVPQALLLQISTRP